MFISGFSVLFWWSVCLWRCHIILSPYDTALNYCSFAVSLKSGHASPTNLFFFKIVSVWDPLHFLWLYFTYNLFSLIYFWPYWVLIAACRLSLVWVSGGTAELQCSGFSLQCFSRCGPRALGHSGSSSCVSQALDLVNYPLVMSWLVAWGVKNPSGHVDDLGSIPELRRFLWRRKWQPIPVFLPGESHGQRRVAGYSL